MERKGTLFPIVLFPVIPLLLATLLLLSCEDATEKKLKIGFSQCVSNDAWRRTMHEEMYRELSFYPELSLEIKDAQGNSQLQVQQIREFQEAGVDLLIVSPNEAEPITPIVEELFQSGIPVIIVDRKITSNLYTAYIGGDNYEIGLTAGQYIKNLLQHQGKILEIWGLRGSSPARDRHRGLLKGLEGSDIQITTQIAGQWEKDTARSRLKEHLLQQDYPQFDLVFGHNDVMTIGANEICRELGIVGKRFVGVDALPGPFGGIQAIADGVLDATFFYPTGGDKAIEVAYKILTGQDFEKENILQTAAVDLSNIRIMKQQTDRIISQQTNIFRQKEMIDSQLEIYKSQRGLLIVLGITLFIAVISLAYSFKSLRDKKEINQELRQKHEEVLVQQQKTMEYAQKAEEATRYKLEFFTNISHEFRTPLTLIQAPVEELIENKAASAFKADLLLVRKNTYRLLRLVNQLMDFRKIDNNKMGVKASMQPVVPFIEDIMSVFQKAAKDNQIHFRLLVDNPGITLWFDPVMMDKVIFNLLSNAFKFTPRKGFIHIHVAEEPLTHEVLITVEDNGLGMIGEDIAHVFDRFFQGKPGIRKTGTGLGLALTKELLELQHASIQVRSEPGEKTIFEIRMKMGNSHFDESQLLTDSLETQVVDHDTFLPDQEESASNSDKDTQSMSQHSILIVEDDKEIRGYLATKLGQHYHILEAADPEVAYAIASDELPDLITCDLMFQRGDGLDLIAQLKANPMTQSIPIIVISAKTTPDEKLAGIKTGVDDYITKPFSISFVGEKIKTLLATRSQLKARFLHELPVDSKAITPQTADKKFVTEFSTLIEENLHDPHFGVSEICREMGLSRGQLYRKAKTVLGYSINDYINKVRLRKAKHLLLEESESIADISHKVGFSTSAYFSTVFKNAFGITPSEYRESNVKHRM
nr:substrate-binding domain-containing protein [Cytophagales bacterium]